MVLGTSERGAARFRMTQFSAELGVPRLVVDIFELAGVEIRMRAVQRKS